MSLKLYYHPLSSFCHKALIALYEGDIAFEPVFVDLSDEKSSAPLRALWPIAKFPVLHDETRNHTVAEATVIIEYLDAFYCGGERFVPADAKRAWQARMWDRFYDLYVHVPLQKIVGDPCGPMVHAIHWALNRPKTMLTRAYSMIEKEMAGKTWGLGEAYGLVDCAASPALFYANVARALRASTAKSACLPQTLIASAILRARAKGSRTRTSKCFQWKKSRSCAGGAVRD